tara:strand:+ start:2203 stop:4146 length:1944 start_codon:yes stop_codon:yes gene_type:complete
MAKQALRLLRVELDEDSSTGEYDVYKLLDLVLAGHVPIGEHEHVERALEWAQTEAADARWWVKLIATLALGALGVGGYLWRTQRRRSIAHIAQLQERLEEAEAAPRRLRHVEQAEREARQQVSELRTQLKAATQGRTKAEGELSRLAAAEDLSKLQPSFDDAIAQAETTNIPILSAKLFDAVAVFVRDLGGTDKKKAALARKINVSNENFKRRVADAHSYSRILAAIGYSRVGTATGGSWQMAEHVWEARCAAKFFQHCAARLGDACATLCRRLSEELGIKFLEQTGPKSRGTIPISWEDFDTDSAAAIATQVLKKGPAAGTICTSFEKMLDKSKTARGGKGLTYKVNGTAYSLSMPQLVQTNERTRFSRSVSFFGRGGRVVLPSTLVVGGEELVSRGPTRQDAAAEQTARLHASEVLKLPDFEPAQQATFERAATALRNSLEERDPLFEKIRVEAVYDIKLPAGRRDAFEAAKQQVQQRRPRGADVQDAFHGSSLGAIASIAHDGFVSTNCVRNAAQFGKGIYLSPVGSGEQDIDMMAASPQYASRDADRLQHVLLCKVITGEPEQVRDGGYAGSDQDKASSDQVDTGVDRLVRSEDGSVDFTQAARLIVWTNKMNEFILPINVVSFKIERVESSGADADEDEDDD